MKIFNFKKIGGFSLSLAIIFSFHSALAQENSIPENLAPLAQELGCQYLGFEIDEAYHRLALQKLNQRTPVIVKASNNPGKSWDCWR